MDMKATYRQIKSILTGSIRRQLILGIALVHAVLMSIFIYDLVDRQTEFLRQQSVKQATSMASTLAANSTSWVLSSDVIGLEEVIQSQSSYPLLRYAMVIDMRGKVLGYTDRTRVGKYVADATSRLLLNKTAETTILVNSDDLIDVSAPITTAGTQIGWARVGLDRSGTTSNLNTIMRDGILYTLLAIISGTGFAIFMSVGLTRGIYNLMSTADSVRQGKFDARADVSRADELGKLASGFNTMLSSLQEAWDKVVTSERRTRDFVEASPGWFWEMDADLRFTYISSQYEEITGSDTASPIGRQRWELNSFMCDDEVLRRHKAELEARLPFHNFEYELKSSTDERLYFSTSGVPVYDKDDVFVGYRGSASDITQRKTEELEIARHRIQLEELVKARTQELHTKAEELEIALETEKRYSTLQQQFISLVSHEFRTPLTIIDGNAQRLIRRKDDTTPEQLVERGRKIRSAVERMVGLIDTTLYASRLDAGKIDMHSTDCDLSELVREVCQRQEEISPTHTLNLDLDGLPDVIQADSNLLEHVFTNLLSNAVKYAPDAPQIDVRGWVKDGKCHVSIKDSGLGIPAQEMAQMFQRYFRAKTATGIKGTGLGLSVSREFTEMHGGDISVKSVEGEGATFTVMLPINGPPHSN